MATIKFLLQSKNPNAPIYCRLSVGQKQVFKRRTGLYCDPDKWSSKKGFPIGKDPRGKKLKSTLKDLSTHIEDKVNETNEQGDDINGNWLQNTIDHYFSRSIEGDLSYLTDYARDFITKLPYRINKANKRGVSTATLRKYTTVRNKLVELEKFRKKRIKLNEVNLDFRQELITFLKDIERLSENTIGRYLKFVKTFVKDAQTNGYKVHTQIEKFKGFTINQPKIILDFEELEILRCTRFVNTTLEATKDWLVIGCFTGQRVSDLLRMNAGMIKTIKGFKFIVLTQQKTGKIVQIPIHKIVQSILDKRNGQFPPVLGNVISSQSTMFNRNLKKVCQQVGINTPTEGNKYDPTSERTTLGTFPKWELVSSHICRRSFATNFYANQKYPTPLLMNITAHGTEVQFLEYIGKKPIDYSVQLAEIWQLEKVTTPKETELRIIKTA